MPMPRKPNLTDWIKVQGGIPQIIVDGKNTKVKHNYEGGDGMTVSTTPDMLEKTVTLDVGGEPVEFPIFLLRMFHGDPCETQSLKRGRKGYERR